MQNLLKSFLRGLWPGYTWNAISDFLELLMFRNAKSMETFFGSSNPAEIPIFDILSLACLFSNEFTF